jgi:hypothetical protein
VLEGTLVEPAPLAVIEPTAAEVQGLGDYGFIMPVATPALLRAAFAQRQALMTAILDERDFIYTVPFTDPASGKQRQFLAARKADADKALGQYETEILAHPKKSGIVKLASALNIQAKRVKSMGLPDDPTATFAWVLYEAVHNRTGRTEQGIGWCDKSEQNGRITTHALITTADTRAYNRAVLRLSGYGTVSAEEILGGAGGFGTIIDVTGTTDIDPPRVSESLPDIHSDVVMAAARTWADAVLARSGERFAPTAQQGNKAFREMRARARRGDLQSAKHLGSIGLHWEGTGQDSPEYETFQVEPSPVSLDDVLRVRTAATPAPAEAQAAPAPAQAPVPAEPGPAAPSVAVVSPAAAMKPAAVQPTPNADDCITTAQAKLLSGKMLEKLGTKDAAVAWLTQNAGVSTSRHVKSAKFDALMSAVTKLEV